MACQEYTVCAAIIAILVANYEPVNGPNYIILCTLYHMILYILQYLYTQPQLLRSQDSYCIVSSI